MTTTNPNSLLFQLRHLVPERPLTVSEAMRIAELQANRLLSWGGISDPGTPTDLIAELPFLSVRTRHGLPASGATKWAKPHWLIVLNADEPNVRQRFSLMHEFKHILDHPFISYLYPETRFTSQQKRAELTADYFAACVLMPKRLIKRAWGMQLQDLELIANLFDVSQAAMARRLDQLGLTEPAPRCIDGSIYLREATQMAVAA